MNVYRYEKFTSIDDLKRLNEEMAEQGYYLITTVVDTAVYKCEDLSECL